MIRQIGSEKVWAAVVSTGRPKAVDAMAGHGTATWYVGPGDYYEGVQTVRVSGLCAARNRALDDAFARGLPCLQLSDDLVKLEQLTAPDAEKKTETVTLEAAAAVLLHELRLSPYRLAGVAPTANAFYASRTVKRRHFVVGDLILVLPCPERFNERLPLKEDYDYTCQHYVAYGGVCRVDWILATFRHRTNPGGAVAVRTPALEQEAIGRLMADWPGWVSPNPRRPNEVLLRLPKLAQARL